MCICIRRLESQYSPSTLHRNVYLYITCVCRIFAELTLHVCSCGGVYAHVGRNICWVQFAQMYMRQCLSMCKSKIFAKTTPTHTHTSTQATHTYTHACQVKAITDSLLLRAPAARSRLLCCAHTHTHSLSLFRRHHDVNPSKCKSVWAAVQGLSAGETEANERRRKNLSVVLLVIILFAASRIRVPTPLDFFGSEVSAWN